MCRSQRTTTSGQFESQQPWCKGNYRGKMPSAVTGDGPGRKSYFYIIVAYSVAYWPRNCCFYIIVYSASVLAKKLLSLLSTGLTGQETAVSVLLSRAPLYWPRNCCLYCLQCLLAKELLSLFSTTLTTWPRNCYLYCLQR